MRKLSLLSCALLVSAFVCWQTTSAQLPKIKLPKTSQPKTQPTPSGDSQPATNTGATTQPTGRSETPTTNTDNSAASQDQPTINKDSLQVTAYTNGEYKGSYDTWSWVPQLEFSVNGPVASGSQLYAEFSMPGAGAWVKFDCPTEETQAGRSMHTTCGGRDGIPEDKGTLYTGVVNFSIKMRNELAGADATLFTGRAKVGKVHSNEIKTGKFANHFVYFVDQDWNLPIGYVYLTADDTRGWDKPVFNLAFWVRGDAVEFQPHLFYQGKEVGKMMYQGEEVGKASCESELDDGTTHFVDDSVPQKAKWSRVRCTFPNVRGWDKTGEGPGMFGPLYLLASNPGDYEFKLLWKNHLARSIKFTVQPGGKLDNGIAAANKLGDDRFIVPVAVIGDQDGAWDKAAWKTEAFYGNPLNGFTPPQ
ncbi:MAG TPA: hypothetical protein VFA21_04030 [Pyrinomonadaceae bacterium]|nr:hypothetical protein [Pyrinomonadaceae bacterium]